MANWHFPARPFSVLVGGYSKFPTAYLTGEPMNGAWQPALFCWIDDEWVYNPNALADKEKSPT